MLASPAHGSAQPGLAHRVDTLWIQLFCSRFPGAVVTLPVGFLFSQPLERKPTHQSQSLHNAILEWNPKRPVGSSYHSQVLPSTSFRPESEGCVRPEQSSRILLQPWLLRPFLTRPFLQDLSFLGFFLSLSVTMHNGKQEGRRRGEGRERRGKERNGPPQIPTTSIILNMFLTDAAFEARF